MKKVALAQEVMELRTGLIILAVCLGLSVVVAFAFPGIIQISSYQAIPIVDGMFRMGPTTGFPVPFTLTQTFNVPPGATRAYGTIAWGPCQNAKFLSATPGYTTGSYPTQACSWIMWDRVPDIVTVTVEYTGNWPQNYIGFIRWFAWEDGNWVPYCLIGEPDPYENCSPSLYIEAQPATIYLPIILRGKQT